MLGIDMPIDTQADILVVDDDPGHRATLETIIKSWGFPVESVDDGSRAVERVKAGPVGLILMDVRMATMDGIEALKQIKAYNPAIPVLIMTAYSSVESAVDALKSGAYDYLTKPLDFEALKFTIERALEHSGLKDENAVLKKKLGRRFDLDDIIGKSRPMQDLMDMTAMIAPSDATILITGESGTGKELIAGFIHHHSPRRDHPMVVVNCAALTETLLESELFGHEKGSFTGADRRREGRFKQADQGTIFLDEIGETSPAMQAGLLRVIQEKEIQRVGGEETIQVDVRILAATNRDLNAEVEAGHFRKDLYYRLNVVALHAPPLRERLDDIPLLAQHFMAVYAHKNRKDIKGFSPTAMDMLLKYEWPGNVRELENAIERAVILAAGDFLTSKDLPLSINREQKGDPPATEAIQQEAGSLRSLEEVEQDTILKALDASGGNKSEAARILGINRKTLHKKLKTYQVE